MTAVLSPIALGLICYLAGLRINTTKSIPAGIYR
jgi:type IV secretory pathway protease TraF